MPRDEPPKRKGTPESRAQNLLRRFPIVDLAKAVSLFGANRNAFLERFVSTFTTMSYAPTRDAFPVIYGAQKPLIECTSEPWEAIERHLRRTARRDVLEANLTASKELFDFIRPKNYLATDCEIQVLRVRLKQIVNIDLNFYITDGERLLFQFPLVRRECLSDDAISVLGSIIHHSYVHGDFSEAEIEIADISSPLPKGERYARIRPVPKAAILSRDSLTNEAVQVYSVLDEIAKRPPKPPEDTTPMGF